MSRLLPALAFVLGLGVLIGAVTSSRSRLEAASATLTERAGPVYLPQTKFLKPMSLGYKNAFADLLWFRAISYFGAHYRSDRTYPWLAHICERVTDLDPRAEYVYQFAGLILPWEAGQVDAGIALLEKGVAALPDSIELSYYLGFSYFFFKGDNRRAMRHLEHAAALPGTHPEIARLLAVISSDTLGPDDALRFLAELEQTIDSQAARDIVREKMREVALANALEEIDNAGDAYREKTGQSPTSVEQLVGTGMLARIPVDPFGGHLEIDPESGKARSSTGKRPSRLHMSRFRERALAGKTGDELLTP